MSGALNMVQLTLACALGIEMRMPDLDWRSGHPRLVAWYEPIAARPSFAATRPPK
jgi:glutathione S-transferase